MDSGAHPFCAASRDDCEVKCNRKWCSGGVQPPSPGNFTIERGHILHTTYEAYVSFTFDLSAWGVFASYNNFSDTAFITAARNFAPALLRIGGTAQDNTTYEMERNAPSGLTEGIPSRVMTRAQWDAMNEFCLKAGWKIVFGLNALQGWHGASGWTWDGGNARELVEVWVCEL